jgi:hypothetical protein
MKLSRLTPLAVSALLAAAPALAAERPIGEPTEKNGMTIGAVYLQAVKMEPHHPGHDNTDIHLEADVKGAKGNPNGFGAGEWIPYLGITYELSKQGGSYKKSGTLVPMVANDGPHYGDNIKLDGPGKYHLVYRFAPPSAQGFLRHVDKETGVGKWWEPFTLEYDFTYTGTGAKSGY